MQRMQHLFQTLRTRWSDDPAACGAAQMAAGALLVAEGVFGFGRRLLGYGGGGDLLGSLVGTVAGAACVAIGCWLTPDIYPDETRTTGRIVDVVSDNHNRNHAPVYAFEAGGREHRFTSSVSSSSRPTIGEKVVIAYSASSPERAHRTDGLDGSFHWIFIAVGGLVLLFSLSSLAVCLVLIGSGIWLFRAGRAERRSGGRAAGFFEDLLSLLRSGRAAA